MNGKNKMNHSKFLPHVMGLRGLAILMIVLFHLSPNNVSQGFLGVEIFMVISGFLLIRSCNLDANFSLIKFAQKKILRTIPPLLVLVVLTWILVTPIIFGEGFIWTLSGSSISSLLCLSNAYYIEKYNDYFNVDANLNPLLHTWYLSIIIQLYTCWAIGFFILKRFGKKITMLSLCSLTLASLLYCFSKDISDLLRLLNMPSWEQIKPVSYFNPFARIWQLTAGGLIFILPTPSLRCIRSLLGILGLAIILVVAFCNTNLPIYGSILMVFGTTLVIKYSTEDFGKRILENCCITWIGKISFSLYLIHFPVFVIYRRWFHAEPTTLHCCLLMIGVIFFSWLFYLLVEKQKWRLSISVIFFCIVFGLSCLMRFHFQLGLDFFRNDQITYPVYEVPHMEPQQYKTLLQAFDKSQFVSDPGASILMTDRPGLRPGEQADFLPIGNMTKQPEFVLVGDSHAQQIYPGFHEMSKDNALSGFFLSSIVVPFWNQYWYGSASYSWSKDKAYSFLSWLKAHTEIHTIVVAQNWARIKIANICDWDKKVTPQTPNDYILSLKEFCSQINAIGKQVILLGQAPIFYGFKNDMEMGSGTEYARWRLRFHGSLIPTSENDPMVLTEAMHQTHNQMYTDMLKTLEREGYCKVLFLEKALFNQGSFYLFEDGVLNLRDRAHITPPAAIKIINLISQDFIHLLQEHKYGSSPFKKSDSSNIQE